MMDIKEFEIPMPWGFVAAKAWGDHSNTLVLMIHGQSDNAGTFDRLIPNLPRQFYYVCIDLPGHGKSTHYPAYLPYHTIYNILTYKIVVNYLKRDKIIIIGHSWGGQIAFMFTQLYPQYVLKLVLLDTMTLVPISVNYFKQFITERIQETIKINQKLATGKPPSYTYDEALNRLMEGRMYGELSKEAATALLQRSLVPLDDGTFRFSTDIRLKNTYSILYGNEFFKKLIRKYAVTCPFLMIIASDSLPLLEYGRPYITEMKRKNRTFFIKKVEGNHDVHNNQPEIVAPLISDFLLKGTSKL